MSHAQCALKEPALPLAARTNGQAWPLAVLTYLRINHDSGNLPQYITLAEQDLTYLAVLRHLTMRQFHGLNADLLQNFTQLETLVLDSVVLDSDWVNCCIAHPRPRCCRQCLTCSSCAG
jgi:hypothetical protein